MVLPLIAGLAAGGGLLSWMGNRKDKKNRRSNQKKFRKDVRKFEKDQKKFFKQEKKDFRDLGKKGEGSERVLETLRKGQKNLLDKIVGRFNPESLDVTQNGLYGQGRNFISDLLSNNPEAIRQFQEPYLRQFNEEIVPGIAERFSGLGEGSQRSSGFQQILARAAERLQSDLAAQRAGLQVGATNQALQYSQQPVQNQFARAQLAFGVPQKNIVLPPTRQNYIQTPQMNQSAPSVTGRIGNALLGGLAGGVGQGVGSGIASGIGNLFS